LGERKDVNGFKCLDIFSATVPERAQGSALLVSVLRGETEAEKQELRLPLCPSRW